jgi:hypothetical protein
MGPKTTAGLGKEAQVRRFGSAFLALSLTVFLTAACTLGPFSSATPTATLRPKARTQTAAPPHATSTQSMPTPGSAGAASHSVATSAFPTISASQVPPAATAPFLPSPIVTPAPPTSFCTDAKVTTLIDSFSSAVRNSDGALLASLVSPTHGLEARLYRNGRVVTYDQQHAKFLFESAFVVDWGAAPGSGLETTGSFHELVVPALLDVFGKTYTLACNQVQVGGSTYQAAWPYSGINFYSAYYPGTQANGNLDWHTWLLGMHYVSGTPYLFSIMQFQWEP